MCGIVGYFHPEKSTEDLEPLYRATELIRHRGPDDEGYACFNLETGRHAAWTGPDSPQALRQRTPSIADRPRFAHHLAFGFRRFSIVDLTENGHQPFWSRDRSVCLIFNGEIYNYVEIRRELEQAGYPFETHCDTEVLLAAYLTWGVDAFSRFNGPLAAAIYDQNQQSLLLARDRVGKSPLYYTVCRGGLYWASDIKPILHLAGRDSFEVNEQAVYDYLRYGWRDLDNTTFWKNIFTLPAASWTRLPLRAAPSLDRVRGSTVRYWDFPASRLSPRDISFDEARGRFRELFLDAVRIRARADAPVAFSLSGGLDSSSIIAAMTGPLRRPVTTYVVTFPGHPNNEEPLARNLYHRYRDQIDYRTYTPGDLDFWKTADEFIPSQEEPFQFPSVQLYRSVLSQARRDGFKVVVNGFGGDELMAGYPHYFFPFLVYLRRQGRYGRLIETLFLKRNLYPGYYFRKRLKNLRDLLGGTEASLSFPPSFHNPGAARIEPYLRREAFPDMIDRPGLPKDFHPLTIGFFSQWMMNFWIRSYNRTHFSVPSEPRSPLLDYRLIDLCLALPPEYLIRRSWTKYILRRGMGPEMPRRIAWNPMKKGFQFNYDVWFQTSKPIVTTLFDQTADNPYLDLAAFRNEYDALIRENPALLWRVICLTLWWRRMIQNQPLPRG